MGLNLATRYGFVYNQVARSTSLRRSQIPSFPWRQHPWQNKCQHIASQTAYQDPALSWAQANPRLAQQCLNPPPVDGEDHFPLAERSLQSFEAYLEWRKWTFPNEIFHESEGVDSGDQRENAIAIISHLLSAPLTLASQFRKLMEYFSQSSPNENGASERVGFDLCCVGARAEASIPAVYWREFLRLSMASMSIRSEFPCDGRVLLERKSLELYLDFVGPDIPSKVSKQSVCVPEEKRNHTASSASISLRNYYRGYFHDVPAVNASNQKGKLWDAYVFFNPGFGHPNLQQSWEPTLKLLLDQGRSGFHKKKSILLLTAHSEKDASRDFSILRDVYGLKTVEYKENPFASRVTYEDPFEREHFVRPNHYVATILL